MVMQSNMNDPAMVSAANTLRTWWVRRAAKGKIVTPVAAAEQARERWPELDQGALDAVVSAATPPAIGGKEGPPRSPLDKERDGPEVGFHGS